MYSMPRNAARLLDWLVILVMFILASVSLGLVTLNLMRLTSQGLSVFPSHWLVACVTALSAAWGLTPLAAALLALKSRGRAGWVWLLGALDVWLSMVVLLYAASGWAREFWVMIEVAMVLLAIGAYWFAPSARKWPPVLAPLPKLSLRRSLAFVLGGIMVCALSSIWTAVIWEPQDKMSAYFSF